VGAARPGRDGPGRCASPAGALSLRAQRLPPSWTPALVAPWVSAARGEADEVATACWGSFACSPISAVFELVLVVVSVLPVSVSPASFSPASLSAASVSECEAECVVFVLSLVLVGVIVATAAVTRMGEEVALGVLAAGLGSGVAAGVSAAARTVADVGAACRVVPIAAAAAAPPITSAPAAATAVVVKVLKGFMGLLAQWRPVAGSGRESPPPLTGIRASGDL
jgi:hypothetical protein